MQAETAPLRLLVTGFGPFPGVADNPTARLVEHLGEAGVAGAHLVSAVLPTAWDTVAEQFDALSASHRPDTSLHFGVSSQADSIRIETTARNATCTQPDVCGAHANAPEVIADGPPALHTCLSAASIVAALTAAGLPAVVSGDAGAYLCNALYYRALKRCGQTGGASVFVHVPVVGTAMPGAPGRAWTHDDLLHGARAVIGHILATHGAAVPVA